MPYYKIMRPMHEWFGVEAESEEAALDKLDDEYRLPYMVQKFAPEVMEVCPEEDGWTAGTLEQNKRDLRAQEEEENGYRPYSFGGLWNLTQEPISFADTLRLRLQGDS